MAQRLSFGSIPADLQSGASTRPADSQTPFRIAILGDFSGLSARGVARSGSALASCRPLPVDRDNFDEVLARLDVQLTGAMQGEDGSTVSIRFQELEDFHPDRLFENVASFAALRHTRSRLYDSATFAEAAAEVRSWADVAEPSAPQQVDAARDEPPPKPTPKPTPDPPPARPLETGSHDLLDQALQETQRSRTSESESPGSINWRRIAGQIAKPYVVPGADPRQGELVACVDAATSALMRRLLHHPNFQALEAAWRSVYFLVRRLETGSALKLCLLDISKQDLAADLLAVDDLTSSGTYRLLVEQTVGTAGGMPWALLLGAYTFDGSDGDVQLLGRLAKVADAAGAPFVAAASGNVVGCPSAAATPDPDDWMAPSSDEDDAWSALRQLSDASYLGLLWPRFLLRLPYGARTNPTEQFDFEEAADDWRHDHYLWGNPAFGGACLLGEAFSRDGWDFRPGQTGELTELPAHVYLHEGETVVHPCGELLLSERGERRIAGRGLTPLLSVKGQDAVRLSGIGSLAGDVLRGRWS